MALGQGYVCSSACTGDADCPKSDAGVQTSCCNGFCTDTSGDSANCGACGKSCGAVANGAPVCRGGACGLSCSAGYADCDGVLANGCEVSTLSNVSNCGSCGHVCMGSNSNQSCQASTCVVTSCFPNFADCNMVAADGCESLIGFDPLNCGACGKVCPAPANSMASCSNSVCGVGACDPGFADCDNMAVDGCEASLKAITSCGMCGVVCAAPANATAGCNAGVCGVGACTMGYGDCDMKASNGCEAILASDIDNCGACGTVCAFADAQASCANGKCVMGACMAGYADCDSMTADGCEVSLQTDPLNCGACGNICPMNTPFCDQGVCGVDDFPEIWFYYYTVDQ